MRIREVKAENYRLFERLHFSFGSSPCLIVVDDNEQGKSTIVRAILDCLYTKKNLCETGEKGRLQLSFTIANDEYIAIVGNNRKRLLKNGVDITREFYKKSGRSYEYLFGEGLFGLNEEEFCNTVLLLQQELDRLDIQGNALSTKIQSMIELSREDHSSSQAIRLLQEGLSKNFPRITVKNPQRGDVEKELRNLNNKIDRLRAEHDLLIKRLASAEVTIREFEDTEKKIKAAEEEIERLRYLHRLSILHEDRRKRERLRQLEESLKAIQPCPSLTEKELESLREKINTAFASYRELQDSASSLKGKIRERKAALKDTMDKLSDYDDVRERSSEDATVLHSIYHEVSELDREMEALRKDIEQRRNSFRFPYDEFSRMDAIFSRLSDTEKHLLYRYRLDRAVIDESLNRLDRLRTLYLNRRYALGGATLSLLISLTGVVIHPAFFGMLLVTLLSLWFYLKNHKAIRLIEDEAETGKTLKEIDASLDELKRRALYLDESLNSLQQRIGYTLDDYQNYMEWSGEFNEIRTREELLNSKMSRKERLLDNARRILGHTADIHDILNLSGRIRESVKLKDRISSIRAELGLLEEQLQQITEGISRKEALIREVAGFVLERTEQAEDLKASWRLLDTTRLVSELNSMLSRTEEASRIAKEAEAIRILTDEETRLLSEGIAEASIYGEEELREPAYYESRLSRMQERAKELHEYQASLLMKRAEMVQLKRRLVETEDELEYLINHKKRAEAYKGAVAKAIEVIEELSGRRYRLWAERLNRETTEIFSAITGRERKVFFEKDLSFRISSDGHELTGGQLKRFLSGGTVEQLFLSIRLTIAGHVCPHIRLPLILDEPFAHADDIRFLNAMRFLINVVSRQRQVVVFSCHRRRHELIKEHISDGYELREGVVTNAGTP